MRSLYRTVRMSLHALRRHALRSALTTLGIVIGVAAVTAMMEIGQGSATAIRQTIARMGANVLMVQPGSVSTAGVRQGSGTRINLTSQDAEAILRECPDVRAIAPYVWARTQVISANRNWVPMYMYGTTPAFLEVRDWQDLDEGEPFTDQDVKDANRVCLLGRTVAHELFPDQSAVGQEVRIQNVPFKVVGVLSRKGANMMGMDQDDILLAPWTTIKFRVAGSSATVTNQSASTSSSSSVVSTAVNTLNQLYPNTASQTLLYPQASPIQQADTPQPVRFANVDRILVSAYSTDDLPEAMRQVGQLLRERHHLRAEQDDDFTIRDTTEVSRALASTSTRMTALLLSVALISLVVGGVGIMNIMLVSVTERTREIGLRMAVGARARDILRQFLAEAVLLCVLGGLLGIALGRGSSLLVRVLLRWPTEPSLWAMAAGVTVSAGVGLVFGYYPAWKASRLDPIDALRYE